MELRGIWKSFKNMVRAWSIVVLSGRFPNFRWISPEQVSDPAWLGKLGEQLAAQYLRKAGYKILYRNFKSKKGGEIDLVCRHRDTLVFVEVKTRTSDLFGRPIHAVDQEKRNRIRKGALAWIHELERQDVPLRFDVVEILVKEGRPEINLVPNAFQPDIRW